MKTRNRSIVIGVIVLLTVFALANCKGKKEIAPVAAELPVEETGVIETAAEHPAQISAGGGGVFGDFAYDPGHETGVTITAYTGTTTVLVIPASINGMAVTGIEGGSVFSGGVFSAKKLTSVTIPNSITWIGSMAFAGNQLTTIVIPGSVTSISGGAFSGNALTSVTIPNSVTYIGGSSWHDGGAFANNKLTSVTIGNSVTEIGFEAFAGNQLTSITIPNKVTSIGTESFANNKLTAVTIGNSVTSIGSSAFARNQLTSVTIPDSVTSIGGGAFEDNQLTTITIPDSVTHIGGATFRGDYQSGGAFARNQLTSVTIGNGASIGARAFAGNPIIDITIGANVDLQGEEDDYGNWLTVFDNGFDDYYNEQGKQAGNYFYSEDLEGWVKRW